jgi:hypothetical protein
MTNSADKQKLFYGCPYQGGNDGEERSALEEFLPFLRHFFAIKSKHGEEKKLVIDWFCMFLRHFVKIMAK